jgi:trehalose 6-phosphate synthase/phosphatase
MIPGSPPRSLLEQQMQEHGPPQDPSRYHSSDCAWNRLLRRLVALALSTKEVSSPSETPPTFATVTCILIAINAAAGDRVWLVSNRLPYRVDSATQALARGDGGLVSALLPVHRAGNSWWVGQGGFPEEDTVQAQMREERILDVNLPADLVALHYNGASNGAIWPLFHYFPAICKFEPAEWDAYKEVNARFADAIAERCGDRDTVWVHDYQLMLLPAMLRALKPRLRIGYFHHVPFPATEVLKTHPARSELLLGLLGSDVVGFHTLEYVRNFTAAVSRVLGFDAVAEDVHVEDRIVRVGAMPLGLDTAGVFKALTTPEHALAVEKLRGNGFGKLILGVDRLDYTKGIPEKLLAFEAFLTKHPDWKGKVALVQLCVPSRVDVDTYSDLRLEIEQLVGRINGKLGWPGWVPIQYLFQTRPLPELTALYRCADVVRVPFVV